MDVVQAPVLADVKLTPFGTFVILSLDPLASVAPLKDERATEEAAGIPRRKYIAIVNMLGDMDWDCPPSMQPLNILFYAAGRDLPEPPFACVGLFDGAAHPQARPPVIPSAPLPWPDCYVHTLEGFSAQITRIHSSAPSGQVCISDYDSGTVFEAAAEDQGAVAESKRPADDDADAGNAEFRAIEDQLTFSLSSNSPHPGAVPRRARRDSAGEDEDSGSSGSSDDSDDSEVDEPRKMTVRAEMWLDIFATDDIGTALELGETISALVKIEREWARREVVKLLANQPRTKQWAAAVVTSDTQDPNVPIPDDASEPADDALVLPEDAIEHRMGQQENAPTPAPADKPSPSSPDQNLASHAFNSLVDGVQETVVGETPAVAPGPRAQTLSTPKQPPKPRSVIRRIQSSIQTFARKVLKVPFPGRK